MFFILFIHVVGEVDLKNGRRYVATSLDEFGKLIRCFYEEVEIPFGTGIEIYVEQVKGC